jgi:hypothetical protein
MQNANTADPGLAQGDLYIPDEVAFRRTGLGFFEVGADCRSRLQQLVDDASRTWARCEVEAKTCHTTSESERAVSNVLRAISIHVAAPVHAPRQGSMRELP